MALQIGIYVESQEGATWQAWHEIACRAEALGLDGLASAVHLRSLQAPGRWALDIWPLMAAIAQWTERIHFGPLVLPVAFYHPAQVARLAADLDRLSNGRFELSLGAGREASEHRAFGLPFPEHDERVAMVAEALQVIRLLWSGEPVSFAGRWYRLEQAQAQPAPTCRWLGVGGNSEPSLRLAAAQAGEWCTTGAPIEQLAQRNRRLDELARAASRQPEAIARTVMNGVLVGCDAAELQRRAGRMAVLVPQLAGQAPEALIERLRREWGWWVGTPEEVAEQAAAAAQAGYDRVFFQVYDWSDLPALDLLAREVAPRLRTAVT